MEHGQWTTESALCSPRGRVCDAVSYFTITADAEKQLRALPLREQRMIETAVVGRLQDDPRTPTRAIKPLRPNAFAEFELRVGDLRVLYNVEQTEVIILIVGRKIRNKFVVAGEEFHGHQDDSTEPARGGPEGDAE